jgi:hypothetical protein
MMTAKKVGMKSWGDLNLALNVLVRQGAITGFRTNRNENAPPVIWVTPPEGQNAGAALGAVECKLTGIFAKAEVRLSGEPDSPEA